MLVEQAVVDGCQGRGLGRRSHMPMWLGGCRKQYRSGGCGPAAIATDMSVKAAPPPNIHYTRRAAVASLAWAGTATHRPPADSRASWGQLGSVPSSSITYYYKSLLHIITFFLRNHIITDYYFIFMHITFSLLRMITYCYKTIISSFLNYLYVIIANGEIV